MNHLTETEIAERLARDGIGEELMGRDRPVDAPPLSLEFPALAELLKGPPRPAAVLVPFLRQNGEWHILYTRRNANLPEHSGQVAFPGGRADPGDPSPEYTALREAQEEIGLRPEDVQILGLLRSYLTVTNYQVTPVVGVIPFPYPFVPYDIEVSRIFTIPLAWLADPDHHEVRLRQLPTPHAPVPVIYFQPYDGEVLWGASARITLHLLELLQ
jgi:8-oxo-dGTP pyrophosphatase MutT (NUDIX family)